MGGSTQNPTSPANGAGGIHQLVGARLRDLHRNQTWLGEEVARILGLSAPVAQTTVSNWMNGRNVPEPPSVFAMERALGLRPGQLSILFGYLPPNARPLGGGVEEAIAEDPYLAGNLKRALLAAYREMRGI